MNKIVSQKVNSATSYVGNTLPIST